MTVRHGVQPRAFVRFGYDYIRGHDPRGSTDRPVRARRTSTG